MPKANEAKKAKAVSKEDIKETVMEEKPATKAKANDAKKSATKVEEKLTTKAKANDAKKSETKTRAPKTANSVTETVCLQYAGREIELSDILAKVKASCEGERAIKDIRVYVKPEENMAYYVVNGDVTGSVVF